MVEKLLRGKQRTNRENVCLGSFKKENGSAGTASYEQRVIPVVPSTPSMSLGPVVVEKLPEERLSQYFYDKEM